MRIESPGLTLRKEFASGPPEAYKDAWCFKSFCPCCRRPLEVNIVRLAEVREGDTLRVISYPRSYNDLPVFKTPTNFEIVGHLTVGDTELATGRPEVVGHVPMVWLEGPVKGAVDRRHLEVLPWATPSEIPESAQAPRVAYCAVIWGANAGYALGAAVLGACLRDLSGVDGGAPDRVLLHTDDVPEACLRFLAPLWKLKLVGYIDGVGTLYGRKGTAFDGVFTKLAAWGLVEYVKVLLLDLDTIPLQSPAVLFELEPPAALVRGNGDVKHGEKVSGGHWFLGESDTAWSWGQGGGINAGVILLRPCEETLRRMVAEVKSEQHPEHISGAGPEQDYLSRYFASKPWRHIDVKWNYQVHHVLSLIHI